MDLENMIPDNEAARVEALKKYNLDPNIQEEEFTALTRIATRICNMPMSLINLVDSEVLWSKAGFGMDLQDIPRDESVCQFTILDDKPLEIEDLTSNPRFKDKAYVIDNPHLRYYAGVPLQTREGFNIGALCVYDNQVNKLRQWQLECLEILADEVMARLNLRLRQQELEKLNQQKDDVLNIVSHDMRNPLMGIMGIANLVKDQGAETEEKLQSMMRLIEESARHLLQNVNDLLDISYIESGSLQLDPSQINIENSIRDTINLQRAAAKVKQIDLSLQLQLERTEGAYDEVRMEQILGNLVTNAIKFTPSGGAVAVRVWFPVESDQDEASQLKLQVEDTGIGIPEKFMDILFTKYGGHGRRGTAGEKSSGLGLPMLKSLVDAHGGNLDVDSEEGQGTTFTVFLPELVGQQSSNG